MILKFVHIIILMIYPLASAQNDSSTIAQPGCKEKCGDVSIPYPFGMKHPKCYADQWFEIECMTSTQTPYLKHISLEVTSIDIHAGMVWIKNPIYRMNCKSEDARPAVEMIGGPFVYSQVKNKFLAVGCNNIAFLVSNGSQVSGCASICDDKEDVDDDMDRASCNGKYCCETSLPSQLSEYNATIQDVSKNRANDQCSWALIGSFHDYPSIGDLKHVKDVVAVLEWEIPNNSTLKLPVDDFSNCYDSNVTSSQNSNLGRRCTCFDGFYGNPYVAGGCKARTWVDDYKKKSQAKWAIIGICSCIGCILLLLSLWRLYKVVRRKIIKKRKEKFFKRNGGLLLEQRLSAGEVNVERAKLFSLKDLEKATDHFNMNRVLGKGGQGTVFKGMLADGKIVAVKKFRVQGKIEEFINEFVILSQINHRNVVNLLGCCLETEIPLLVYEFIPNGNLFEYLHGQNDDLPPMTWDMRLRIATEVAGALFYLHSAASQPIYHRDIKSTNILLDGKYKPKVADFGTSRMISIEATHLTTVVQGTFGYLDPEYFRTSQYTDKSDVYSFGVVLVELLTGQKPISSLGSEEAKSLASYFILSMEENHLFDIIDERVTKEGEKGHIITVANLASRCLELNGKKRPTMKEVALELEGIWKLVDRKSNVQENKEETELAIAGIEDYQPWIGDSTSNSLPTLSTGTLSSNSEVMHIIALK